MHDLARIMVLSPWFACFSHRTLIAPCAIVETGERRFFHYTSITKELQGVKGKRAKLPKCVQRRIAEMYPDTEGAPTKEGSTTHKAGLKARTV